MSQYSEHKKAIELLKKVESNRDNFLLIHYSCENFLDKDDGRTPRITTIAVRYLESAQTKSFSIHEIAEFNKVPIDLIEENYNELELKMLDDFFAFVKDNLQKTWIHWNMRASNYGFYAIENRYKVLGGIPTIIPENKKLDLARLLVNCYGRHYIGHPRIEKLVEKNFMTKLDFLTGKQEAEAFENKKYISLRSSTLRKVDLFSSILTAAANNTLKTNSTWKDKYGISIQGIYEALNQKWWFQLTILAIGWILGVLTK